MIETADVVVIGAGTAGIPAAVFASDRGARVILIEAEGRVGGTLHVSSGHMSGAGSRLQKSRGIDDSASAHFDDVMRISRSTAEPVLVRLATDHAGATIDWLVDNDFDMAPECPVISYSHESYRTPRTYWGRDAGRSIAQTLARVLDDYTARGKVDLRLHTRMTAISRGSDGDWITQTNRDGHGAEIRSRNVVLATGGYAANRELFAKITGGLPLLSPAPASADGSGLQVALGLGGNIRGADIFLPSLGGVPDVSGGSSLDWAQKAILTPQYRMPWEIFVNLAGQRFVAEDSSSPDSKERALKLQPELAFWVIYDDAIRGQAPPLFPTRSDAQMADSFSHHASFVVADSLTELAARCGFDQATFGNTIATYNDAQRSGQDIFGRTYMPMPIGHSKFYAIRHQGVTMRCWAGVDVDENLRILGSAGEAMDGLYAVGEILGGARMSGDSFAGGMSITPALTFGRLLGQTIMKW